MISPEILRQYAFFDQLNETQLKCLSETSQEESVAAGTFLFHNGDELNHFYLVIKGEFEIILEAPKLEVEYDTHGQPSQLQIEQVILSSVGSGNIIGWSGLVAPYRATSGGRARVLSQIISFDCKKLLQCFENDCSFGFYMIQTAAQAIGKRIQDIYKGGGL